MSLNRHPPARNRRSIANLKPAELGEVRNPTGRNQYSARREAEKAWDRIALEVRGDKRRLDAFLDRLWQEAEKGEVWAAKAILERLLPITAEVEFPQLPTQSALFVPTEEEQQALEAVTFPRF